MANSVQKSLVKPLEPSSCAAAFGRPEHLDPGRGEIVGQTGHQRHLRSYHHKADIAITAEGDDGGMVGGIECHALGHLGDSGVARRAIELRQQGLAEMAQARACSRPPEPKQYGAVMYVCSAQSYCSAGDTSV